MDSISVKGKGFWEFVLFWASIACFNFGTLFEEYTQIFNFVLVKLMMMLGGFVAFAVVVRNLNFRTGDRSRLVWLLFYSTLVWCALMFFRSEPAELMNKFNYMNPYSIIPYLCLLMFFMPVEPMLRSLLAMSKPLNIIFMLLFWIPIVLGTNTTFVQFLLESFGVGAAFLYITNRYHPMKHVVFSIVVLLAAFLVATLTGRRNLMLTFALYLMIGSLLMMVNGKIKNMETKFILVVMAVLTLIGSVAFYLGESKGAFSTITSRAKENTREEVFVAYVIDMANVKDLSVGRGMLGKYYCPGIDGDTTEDMADNEYRKDIECGYLQLILKGGVLLMILYVSLFVIGIRNGLWASNQLCKGAAYILGVQLIDMIAFGLHAFNTKTFMLWMLLALCLNRSFLQKTDEEIQNMFYKKKYRLLSWQKK